MFRIRRIYDAVLPVNQRALEHVARLLREQFPGAPKGEFGSLGQKLRNPLRYRFRAIVFVAESASKRVLGAAVILHEPDLHFVVLDYVSAGSGRTGGGIGGALYQRVREEARDLGARAMLMECLPDDPALSPDPKPRAQNRARLRFYERFGARPVEGTRYESPVTPGEPDPPYLVVDALGHATLPSRDEARQMVRALLERKYVLAVKRPDQAYP